MENPVHFNIAPKLGLIFMFLNDCDRSSFKKTSKKIFRDFASFVSKVQGVSSLLDAQLCLTAFNTTENLSFCKAWVSLSHTIFEITFLFQLSWAS